jgi:hypothetical protein
MSVSHDDEVYFRRRAEQELDLAQRAIDSAVVFAHYRLAEAYLEKLELSTQAGVADATLEAGDKPLFDFGRSDSVS